MIVNSFMVEGREERYQFTWPDKKKAILAANAPIAATLRPVKAESVGKNGTPGGWDSENLYIEGDNLDVLKLLQETYLSKVKMIYIVIWSQNHGIQDVHDEALNLLAA